MISFCVSIQPSSTNIPIKIPKKDLKLNYQMNTFSAHSISFLIKYHPILHNQKSVGVSYLACLEQQLTKARISDLILNVRNFFLLGKSIFIFFSDRNLTVGNSVRTCWKLSLLNGELIQFSIVKGFWPLLPLNSQYLYKMLLLLSSFSSEISRDFERRST